MAGKTKRHVPQTAGSRMDYPVNTEAVDLQITIGGRDTGSVVFRYRPYLPGKPLVERADFEQPADFSISFETSPQGVKKRTFVLKDTRLSWVEIDDSGNSALGDFWVSIVQY